MKYLVLALILTVMLFTLIALILVNEVANTTYAQCAGNCNRLVLSGVWGIPDPNAPEPQTKAWFTMYANQELAAGREWR